MHVRRQTFEQIKSKNPKINLINMEQTKLKRFKRILLIFLFVFVLGTGIFMCATSNTTQFAKPMLIEHIDTIKQENKQEKVDTISIKDSIQNEIVNEVAYYLKRQSPKAHKFIPKYLVQAGLNNDIDICFMMAQTQIETNFGTTGAGRDSSRRSLFGVAIRKYANYETAINDYCALLKKSYLGKGRTEKHLMAKYVTHSGARYAGNPRYEAELTRTYKDIVNKTRIHSLQNEWKRM